MFQKISPYLTFFLGWPLSLLALFFIGRTFFPQLQQISTEITTPNIPLLVLGVFSFIGYFVLRSYVWYRLLQSLDYKLPLRESLYLWASSQIKRYIPGNVWSFLGVTLLFSEKKVKKSDIAHALVIEAQLVLLSSLFLSLLALPFIVTQILPLGEWGGLAVRGSILLVIIGTLLYLLMPFYLRKNDHPLLNRLKHLFPRVSLEKTLVLFLFMFLSFISFGLGYYFTISSIVFLDPIHLLFFVGYFVLSLLLGYLSFITPSGLGVREGIITVGLIKFIPLSLAGFAAVFGRVVLVISEILFIILMYLLTKSKGSLLTKSYAFIKNYTHEVIVALFFIIFSLYFSIISILRYENYYTGRFDLGNMAQTVWNTYHGRIFELTDPNGTEIVSRLAFHADFILILFAPFYAIWESPNMLLLLQAIIVGVGGIFVYLIAKDILGNKILAVVLSLLYFFNPSVQRATLYDFHAVTLATTFFLGAFYFLNKKQYWLFLLFALFAGITKEQVWAVIALLGLYIGFFHKKWKLGLSIFVICVSLTYILIWHAIPNASGGEHFALSYYQQTQDGDSPSDLIKTVIFDPGKTLSIITQKSRLNYLNQLLMPLGYLPLGAPLYLLFTGPDIMINMLSAKPQLHQIYYQYTANITPFLFIATIFSLKYIFKKSKISPTVIIIFLSITGITSAYLYGPLPGAKDANLAMITRSMNNKDKIDALIKNIPEEAKVAASNGLGSHLSHRQYLYTLPRGVEEAEYILISRGDPNNSSGDNFKDLIQQLKGNKLFREIYDDGNVVGFQKIPLAKHK